MVALSSRVQHLTDAESFNPGPQRYGEGNVLRHRLDRQGVSLADTLGQVAPAPVAKGVARITSGKSHGIGQPRPDVDCQSRSKPLRPVDTGSVRTRLSTVQNSPAWSVNRISDPSGDHTASQIDVPLGRSMIFLLCGFVTCTVTRKAHPS
jgi:hypothetical protein